MRRGWGVWPLQVMRTPCVVRHSGAALCGSLPAAPATMGACGSAARDALGAPPTGVHLSDHYDVLSQWLGGADNMTPDSGVCFLTLPDAVVDELLAGSGEALEDFLVSSEGPYDIDMDTRLADLHAQVVVHSDALWEDGCAAVSDFWMHNVEGEKLPPRSTRRSGAQNSMGDSFGNANPFAARPGSLEYSDSFDATATRRVSVETSTRRRLARRVATKVLLGQQLLRTVAQTQRLAILPVPDHTARFWRAVAEGMCDIAPSLSLCSAWSVTPRDEEPSLRNARMFRVFVRDRRVVAASQLACTNYDPAYSTLAHGDGAIPGILRRMPDTLAPESLPEDFIVDVLVTPALMFVYAMNRFSTRMSLFREGEAGGGAVRVRELLRGPCIAIGDTHGQLDKLTQLIENTKASLGEEVFNNTHVVFLGDMVDRGLHVKPLVQYLIDFEASRPYGLTHFLHGNHDFAFSAFAGLLPIPEGVDFTSHTDAYKGYRLWKNSKVRSRRRMKELAEPDVRAREHTLQGMHIQGRRYAPSGSSHFSSRSTFASYGVAYGDRDGLVAAMGLAHRDFFRSLRLVVEHERYVFVHSGLEQVSGGAWEHLTPVKQLDRIRNYDISETWSEYLTHRDWHDVPTIPDRTVVSGHVVVAEPRIGKYHVQIDTSGGHEDGYLSAVAFPEMRVFASNTGTELNHEASVGGGMPEPTLLMPATPQVSEDGEAHEA